jgi:hypothetical protein
MQGLAYDLATRLPALLGRSARASSMPSRPRSSPRPPGSWTTPGRPPPRPWLCPMWRARIRARSGPSSGGPC